uniref:NADH:ubiquinone reductase (H(+)-translocating) n=1 Tax=Capsala pricei TaxID=651779 RepID=A0A6G7WE32_9PLAT|nr:NADH dehydrogenase subunit 5 [Capsala pricei]QIK50406.1 NADH dehydrogenase subunit 5 [Capsala pricei]
MSLLFVSFFLLFLFGLNAYLGFSINISNHGSFILSYSLDLGSNYCLLMLFFCVSISFLFSLHYFTWAYNHLNSIISLFVCVMVYLVLSSDLFNTLIGWEYLGFISFLLILFYSTYDTVRASNTTLISSRFGDVGLFLIIGLSFKYFDYPLWLFVFCFFLVVSTKSACIPFTSWLLEAMRAPTPVSCLVHSSTLVAAGIWFLYNYGYLFSGGSNIYLLLPCIITVILSSISSLFFLDVKKLVALSTCNNISWCVIYYCLGFSELCLIQLFSHGVAKCMLFCVVGDLLSSSGANQINSGLFSSLNQNNFSSFIPCLLILFVSGLPFQGVFFSKHFLLGSNSYSFNSVLIILVYTCVLLTYFYSFRLFMLVSNIFSGQSSGFQHSFFFLGGLFLIGCLFNFYLSFSLEESLPLFYYFSLLVIFCQIIGCIGGWILNSNLSYPFSSVLYGQDSLVSLSSLYFSFLWNSLFYISNFRLERYFSIFLSNLNIYSLGFGGIIQLNIFFCFMLVSLCVLLI